MKSERIGELLQPFLAPNVQLEEVQLNNISIYIDILLKWNAHMNLTAVRQPEEIVQRHFGECLFAARQLFPDPAREKAVRVLDIGSGAGFPGLPIKIWAPPISLTLIESNQKKATFLREIIRLLTLTNIDVFSGRAENYEKLAEVVTLRAVERFETALPIAANKVTEKGRLGLLIGQSQVSQVRELAPSFHWSDPARVPKSKSRVILIGTL